MFNNPLRKYQSGGSVPSKEQQEMLMAFVEWLPKRVKEFANMNPDQIVEALNGMSQSPEGQKQVEQLMQQFKQEISSAQPSQFEKGGKLHDFVCKHAKGGYIAGCGCKVPKAQNGTSGIPTNSSALDMYLMNTMQMPNSGNLFTGQQVASIVNAMHLNQPLVQAQEDGGKVKKEQKGSKWVSADKTITIKNPGTAQADTLGTYSYPSRNGEFHFAPNGERTLTEWFNGDVVGQRYASPEWFQNHPYRNALERMIGMGRKPLTPELEENVRQRVANRTKSQENGGVVMAQGGIKGLTKAVRWIKSASGNKILIDGEGKVLMKEIPEWRSGATQNAVKILEKREPWEVAGATDYANRMMVIRENADLPWSAKQAAYEKINPEGRLFQPWKPRTKTVDIKKPE